MDDGQLALAFLRALVDEDPHDSCYVDLDGETSVCLDGWVRTTPQQVALLRRLYAEVRGRPYEAD